MNKRHKEALKTIGFTVENYSVCPVDSDMPMICGIALIRSGRDAMVIEQKPRGWGGDGKWRVYRHRCPRVGRNPLQPPYGEYKTQREAVAGVIMMEINS